MKRVLTVLGVVLGVYLIVRAVAEPFVIDVTDPATYRDDWGGPTLAGVLLVHCGPGVLAALLMIRAVRKKKRPRREDGAVPGDSEQNYQTRMP
jgi:hypothetical protein